ncbi:hypothetical protein GALMADRAFT_133674 [Galerina marginata CBS 339.88]|uniref:HSF-type DNA-binding domain-containing protein n=1 Tax=Galerina marginata (strain CBS 339.88) TaxID=685588 RepID=A0A067TM91_GALM3|nr:hypothetical protein GALMADRAFT_133674 [Galerina marginata CBS 339.88]
MSHNEDDIDVCDDMLASAGRSPPPPDLLASTTDLEFARKLYDMLEDSSVQGIICWGPLRDRFIVKDRVEFITSVLPRILDQSSFASFVRQLNEYGFKEVRDRERDWAGEHTSTFYHQDFHGDRRDDLQKIKRKPESTKDSWSDTSSGSLPSEKCLSNAGSSSYTSSSDSRPYGLSSDSEVGETFSLSHSYTPPSRASMKITVDHLREEKEDLQGRILHLEMDHEKMGAQMAAMGRDVAQQHGQLLVLLSLLGTINVNKFGSIWKALANVVDSRAPESLRLLQGAKGAILDIARVDVSI